MSVLDAGFGGWVSLSKMLAVVDGCLSLGCWLWLVCLSLLKLAVVGVCLSLSVWLDSSVIIFYL